MEPVTRFIEQNFGLSFLIGVIAVGAVISGTVWLAIWLYKVISKNKEIENSIKALPCAEHSAKLDRIIATETKVDALPCAEHMEQIRKHDENHNSVLARLSSIDTTLIFLQKGVEGLTETLQKSNKIVANGFTQTHSPLSITPKGDEMVKRLGVDEMFERNWSRIETLIQENAGSHNPYDIQQFCIQQAVVFPEKFLSEDDLDKIKLDAYNIGESLMSYMRVVAVMARDRYFKTHNIDINEVDKNDPSKK